MEENVKYILLGRTLEEIKAWTTSLGMPSYTARQLMDWIYKKRVRRFEDMSNIALKYRTLLAEKAELGLSSPSRVAVSVDGTKKYLFSTASGTDIESVYIPDKERATLCVSSQAGCKMHCAFCMTGRMGFKAQLQASEILNQILSIPESEQLTNLVFMGMGEPCDNIEAVLSCLSILTSEHAFAWSPKRITVSSIGLLPGLKRVLDESHCHIAISLHTPDVIQRREWIPAEKAWPIKTTLETLRSYDFSKQRRLSFEYIMFKDQNDGLEHAKALLILLKGLSCRINLIRFHTIPDTPFVCADEERIQQFAAFLTERGVQTTVRASRGEDIQAACGLLSTAEKIKKAKA